MFPQGDEPGQFDLSHEIFINPNAQKQTHREFQPKLKKKSQWLTRQLKTQSRGLFDLDAHSRKGRRANITWRARLIPWMSARRITRPEYKSRFDSAPGKKRPVAVLPMISPRFVVDFWAAAKFPDRDHKR